MKRSRMMMMTTIMMITTTKEKTKTTTTTTTILITTRTTFRIMLMMTRATMLMYRRCPWTPEPSTVPVSSGTSPVGEGKERGQTRAVATTAHWRAGTCASATT